MYLHVGNDVVVHHSEVIGIFDLENTSVSKYTKEYLRFNQKDRKVITVTKDIPKSFVVTSDKKKKFIFRFWHRELLKSVGMKWNNDLKDERKWRT